MRDLLFWGAASIAAAAQLLSHILFLVLWLGSGAWLMFQGTILGTAAWFAFGSLAALLIVSLARLPFNLLGLLLAALAGRRREYLQLVAELNDG